MKAWFKDDQKLKRKNEKGNIRKKKGTLERKRRYEGCKAIPQTYFRGEVLTKNIYKDLWMPRIYGSEMQ